MIIDETIGSSRMAVQRNTLVARLQWRISALPILSFEQLFFYKDRSTNRADQFITIILNARVLFYKSRTVTSSSGVSLSPLGILQQLSFQYYSSQSTLLNKGVSIIIHSKSCFAAINNCYLHIFN